MPTVHRSFHVDPAPDRAWSRLADLEAIPELLDFLEDATVDGDRRVCSMGAIGVLEERILSVDHDARRVAYTIVDAPLPLTHHSASMTVSPAPDGGSEVVWITDFRPAELAAPLEQLIDQGVASMTAAMADATTPAGGPA